MSQSYDPTIDLHYLRRIADDNLAGAIYLSNTNHNLTVMHLLHESLEKYLKVLWAENNIQKFSSEEELSSMLKDFSHNILKLVNAMPPDIKQRIEEYFTTQNLIIYKLNPLRFAEIKFMQWSTDNYLALKIVIENIRDNLVKMK